MIKYTNGSFIGQANNKVLLMYLVFIRIFIFSIPSIDISH